MALHNTLSSLPIRTFLMVTASESPTPGGGSSAALAGAMAAAIVEKVARKTQKRAPRATAVATRARAVWLRLLDAVQQDARSYQRVVTASKREDRRAVLRALAQAIAVPRGIARDGRTVIRLIHRLRPLCSKIWRSDLRCAWLLAEASLGAALAFVIANRQYLRQWKR